MFVDLRPYSFCLIRHGETVANRDQVIAGWMDVPLTELGRDQAFALQMMDWPTEFVLFSSQKERAKETARLAFPNKEAELVQGLAERNWGIFEGRPLEELPDREKTPEQGESWPFFLQRTGDALLHCCKVANGKLPVIVCHSGVIRAARILTGQTSVGVRAPNAKPILFRWTGETHSEERLSLTMS